MNNLSATDILLYGALVGAVVVAFGAVLWACAYRGRQRWSAERRAFYERAAQVGHGGS
jgi:gas vesicle protein